MTFLSEIEVRRPAGEACEWELLADLVYVGSRDKFIVPKGFKTDFASIPRLFQNLIPKNGRHDAAAIVHDYLYRCQPFVTIRMSQTVTFSVTHDRITRLEADGVFRRILKELGVGYFRRSLMYRAVRLGGRRAWSKWQPT